jgi:hypothetical protein
MAYLRKCRCNGCFMVPERISPAVLSHWCPHMDSPGQIDIARHLAWQRLNKVPDWLCKIRTVPAAPAAP